LLRNHEGEIMRTFKTLSISELIPGLPAFNGGKTYAAWPVWSDSARDEVKYAPVPKKQAIRLYHKARQWNRLKTAGRYGGTVGSAPLRVLECLLFDFLNYASGRLDPSYEGIARKTGLCRRTIATALARLKELGIIHWLRRCAKDTDAAGRFLLRQQTNAYAVVPASQWRGFVDRDIVPPPDPSAWGAAPPLPSVIEQAIVEQADGGSIAAMLRILEADPDDEMASALAQLGNGLHSPQH
jgi:hypothetical protein